MLWSTLHRRIGAQPMRVTNHTHVAAVIDGREILLDLKFDAAGRPYLAASELETKREKG